MEFGSRYAFFVSSKISGELDRGRYSLPFFSYRSEAIALPTPLKNGYARFLRNSVSPV